MAGIMTLTRNPRFDAGVCKMHSSAQQASEAIASCICASLHHSSRIPSFPLIKFPTALISSRRRRLQYVACGSGH